MSKSQSLELFYINGYPDGMVTAELYNWTGHVLKTPRTRLAEALQRPESGYTGLYLLLGEADGDYRAYIGEGENIAKRISLHDMNKQWWDSAVLITTAANKLNKAHIRYLEARLIAEAKEIIIRCWITACLLRCLRLAKRISARWKCSCRIC